MKTSKKGLDLIIKYETGGNVQKYLTAYQDSVGVWTIGIGSTYYEDGTKVKRGDKISLERAYELFQNILPKYEKEVNRLVTSNINQNQFDALVSFTYNLGGTNLGNSTLLKKVNKNPNDPTIASEFVKWNKAGGKVLAGLTKRRKEESELYFSGEQSESSTVKKKTTSDLNLRKGPSTDYSVLEVIKNGGEVHVLSEKNNWLEVLVCASGSKGWVSSKYIK